MYEQNRIHIDDVTGFPSTATASEVKQPQVHEAIHGLESTIEEHLKMCAELEQRLAPVLRSEPQAAGNDPKDATTQVAVAQRINDSTIRLRKVLDGYRSMLRRLEV